MFRKSTLVLPKFVYLILGIVILGNIALTIPKIRKMLTPNLFLGMIVVYAVAIVVLLAYSEDASMGQSSGNSFSESPYFLIFLFPIILASLYYGMRGAAFIATLIGVIDIAANLIMVSILKDYNIEDVFNFSTLVRLALYYLIALFISNIQEEKMKIVKVKDEKSEEYKKLVKKLSLVNEKLEKDVAKIEEERNKAATTAKKTKLLLNISQNLSQNLDLRMILSATLTKIRELVLYHSGAIFFYDSDKSELYMAAHEGLYEDEMQINLRSDIGIPYMVAQTRRSLVINDTANDPRFNTILSNEQSVKVNSAIYLPITHEKEVFGVICLWSMEKNSYGEEDIRLLTTVTREAARSINNAELYKKLDTRFNFVITLWQISKSLTSSLDLSASWEKVLEEVLRTTGYLFNSDKLIFFQYKKELRELSPYIAINVSNATKKNFVIKLKQEEGSLPEFMVSNFQVHNVRAEARFSMIAPFAVKEGFTSMLWSPLRGRNRLIGSLALFSTEQRKWTSEDIQWLDIFTNMLSMTLENVQLLVDLVSEKTQLQALIDNVPEGVYTTDANRRILTWNRAAEKITGFKMSDVTGNDCCNTIQCQNVENTFCKDNCPINLAIEKQEKVDSGLENVFIINSQKELIPAFITAAPIFDEAGQVNGAIMVFRDITKEKEIERMKEEFLATITHDLKSPLASIMGYTELILNPKLGTVTQNQKEFLNAILRASNTLQILINNILESTRMEAGKMTFNPVLFKLSDLVTEIAEMFRPLLAHKSLNFEAPVDTSIVVYGDREKLREVFINLISNALKFTPEGGLISIGGVKLNGQAEVRVSDTGKGIPNSEIPKLFQKFSQVKGEKRGTGLGLYICKRIVEAHEQKIWVESVVGEGTSFIFTLPTYKNVVDKSAQKTILIVENDEPLAGKMKKSLIEHEYHVNVAPGFEEALKLLNDDDEQLPQVAVIDWHLPDGEALKLMEYIRENEKLDDMALLLLCDYREEISGDFDAVVNKPINFRDLLMKANAFAQP
ncbi:MAG: GAF domain-containing protein [Candidatus Eremiobacteraeota bacterium]|nr:GAF domain-containing protein [Candidatus Eremiobacteraeota bacterium]